MLDFVNRDDLNWLTLKEDVEGLKKTTIDRVAKRVALHLASTRTNMALLRHDLGVHPRDLYKIAVALIEHGFRRDAEAVAERSTHGPQVREYLNGGTLERPLSFEPEFDGLTDYFNLILSGDNQNFKPQALIENYERMTGHRIHNILIQRAEITKNKFRRRKLSAPTLK